MNDRGADDGNEITITITDTFKHDQPKMHIYKLFHIDCSPTKPKVSISWHIPNNVYHRLFHTVDVPPYRNERCVQTANLSCVLVIVVVIVIVMVMVMVMATMTMTVLTLRQASSMSFILSNVRLNSEASVIRE